MKASTYQLSTAASDFDFGPLLNLATSLAGGQLGADPGKLLALCGSCIVS